MAVTVLREDESEATFRIVGEDEADPSTGRIAWIAPVAQVSVVGATPIRPVRGMGIQWRQ
jgi:hypothetical protein